MGDCTAVGAVLVPDVDSVDGERIQCPVHGRSDVRARAYAGDRRGWTQAWAECGAVVAGDSDGRG